jgi:hypothetical protein
MIHQQLAN